jgi:hypothetical protein
MPRNSATHACLILILTTLLYMWNTVCYQMVTLPVIQGKWSAFCGRDDLGRGQTLYRPSANCSYRHGSGMNCRQNTGTTYFGLDQGADQNLQGWCTREESRACKVTLSCTARFKASNRWSLGPSQHLRACHQKVGCSTWCC